MDNLGYLLQVLILAALLIVISALSDEAQKLGLMCEQYHGRREIALEDSFMIDLRGGLKSRKNCSVIVKTDALILVKFIHDLHVSNLECRMELTLAEPTPPSDVHLQECVDPPKLRTSQDWISSRHEIHAIFTSKQIVPTESITSSGPFLVFVRISGQDNSRCASVNLDGCSSSCKTLSSVCGKINVCHGNPEKNSYLCDPSKVPSNPALETTTLPLVSTTPAEFVSDIYLWLPLIVVIVFTIVMLALILAGRGSARCNDENYRRTPNDPVLEASPSGQSTIHPTTKAPTTIPGSGLGETDIDFITIILVAIVFVIILVGCAILGFREQRIRHQEILNDSLRLDANLNSVNTEGGPPTPPPTYSYIERQTSYVSHISQSDSQISIPPSYEDAVDVHDDPQSWRRRFRRNLSRSSSTSSRPSRRFRFFQRSMSAQEATASQGRYTPNPENRVRHASDQTAENNNFNRESIASDSDSVFVEPNSSSDASGAVAINTNPSGLDDVSEVDETLGSTLVLGGPAMAGNNINYDPTAGANVTTADVHPSISSSRPILARSISDVTSGRPVTFSLE